METSQPEWPGYVSTAVAVASCAISSIGAYISVQNARHARGQSSLHLRIDINSAQRSLREQCARLADIRDGRTNSQLSTADKRKIEDIEKQIGAEVE